MKRLVKSTFIVPFFILVILMPFAVQAKVYWEISNAVQLEETPIDVAQTQSGDLTFILTDQAEVIIYAVDGKVVGTIPVDPSVTDIAVSAKGEQLYLINSKRKTLQTVAINFTVDLNVADSPFLGPAEAGVVLVVFSDFQ
jgi:hypothetical protein